jgi:hypothetical protein
MTKTKSPLQSLTVVSAAASALVSILGATGAISAQTAGEVSDTTGQLISAGLALAAIYGRFRATSRIGRQP